MMRNTADGRPDIASVVPAPPPAGNAALPIGTPVTWNKRNGETVRGHVTGRGRKHARIEDERGRPYRAAWSILNKDPTREMKDLSVRRSDLVRARLKVGQRVAWSGRAGRRSEGTIVRLNRRTATVDAGGGESWRIGYELLETPHDAREATAGGDDPAARLEEVAALARRLLDEHGLESWRFELGRAERQLGVCRSHTRTIVIGTSHATRDPMAKVRETILHEIAHAIAGPEAGHGPRWKVVARGLGIDENACASPGEGAWTAQRLAGCTRIEFPDRDGSTAHAAIVRLNPRRVRALWNGRMVTVPYGLITGAS